MANYWLHRISHDSEVSYPLLEKGYLSIGWIKLLNFNLTSIESEEEFDRTVLKKEGPSRWCLWNFLQFKPDDIVVVPMHSSNFAICRVCGGPQEIRNVQVEPFKNSSGQKVIQQGGGGLVLEDASVAYDIGYLVKVEVINKLPRSYAEPALQARMKMRQTNGNINDLKECVGRVKESTGPISVHTRITESIIAQYQSAMQKYVTPANLENIIKWYFEKKGADNVYIPPKYQKNKPVGTDADVIAEFTELGVIFYVQCKQHIGESDIEAIEEISNFVQSQLETNEDTITHISWALTTAKFSAEAKELAVENHIRTIEGDELCRMLIDLGIDGIDNAYIK